MPRLPAYTPQRIINVLDKNGFILDRVKGSHYIYYHPGTKRRAVVPFRKKELPKGTLIEILKQAGISKAELRKIK